MMIQLKKKYRLDNFLNYHLDESIYIFVKCTPIRIEWGV
jgi:hypothetical protein